MCHLSLNARSGHKDLSDMQIAKSDDKMQFRHFSAFVSKVVPVQPLSFLNTVTRLPFFVLLGVHNVLPDRGFRTCGRPSLGLRR